MIVLTSCVSDEPRSADNPLTAGPLLLKGPPVCRECRIELAPVATLGRMDDPSSAQANAALAGCTVAATNDSTFLLGAVVGGGQIFKYGRDGRLVSTIGRKGEGPGDFGSRLLLVAAGDTVIVVDNDNARIVKMDPNGAILGSFRLPVRVNSIARLANGRYLLHQTAMSPTAPLFWLLDGNGEEIAKVGRFAEERWTWDQWVVSPGKSADYWAASMWEYRLFRGWRDSLATAAIRDVDWFPSGTVFSLDILVTKPAAAKIMYLHETDDHLLWVFVLVADPDWKPGTPYERRAEWYRDSFDTMIEVIDLEHGRVLASRRSDDLLGGMCGTNLVYAVIPEADGNVTVSVFEPRLTR